MKSQPHVGVEVFVEVKEDLPQLPVESSGKEKLMK